MISVQQIQEASRTRADRWHRGKPTWSLLEWAGCMCGESGEAANVAKKIKRIDDEMRNIDGRYVRVEDRNLPLEAIQQEEAARRPEYIQHLGKEVADAILYGFCLLNAAGLDAETVLRDVFNKKSEAYGFPERI